MPFMGIEHWTIAICDDDEIFLSRLEKQIRAELQQLNVVGEIVSYTDSEKLLETKLHQTEIFFLDIDMPEVTGMELAAKLEEQNPQAIVIFISNHEEAVFEAIPTISHFVALEMRISVLQPFCFSNLKRNISSSSHIAIVQCSIPINGINSSFPLLLFI